VHSMIVLSYGCRGRCGNVAARTSRYAWVTWAPPRAQCFQKQKAPHLQSDQS
jgi:hypothetical protein